MLPDFGAEREEPMGLGATSTISLLLFADQWTCPPERHEVNASGARRASPLLPARSPPCSTTVIGANPLP